MFSNFFIFTSIVFCIGLADAKLAKTKKCCSNQYMVNNNFKKSQCNYKKTFSAVCASNQECDESKGLMCNGKCSCNSTSYWDLVYRKCNTPKGYGAICYNIPGECDKTKGLNCEISSANWSKKRICSCNSAYTWNKNTSTCALNEKNSLCKPGFEYYNGGCYYFSTMIKSWSDASLDCLAKTSNLAIINNLNEFNYISGYAKTRYVFSFYLGAQGDTNNSWKWVDGNDLAKNASWWCKGEPNNPRLEHCALLYNYFYMGSFKMCLNDVSCGFKFNYVCEYSSSSTITTTPAIVTTLPIIKKTNGEMCTKNEECDDTSGLLCKYYNGTNICMCDSNQYWDKLETIDQYLCRTKKPIGGNCTSNNECDDTIGLDCSGLVGAKTCTCPQGFKCVACQDGFQRHNSNCYYISSDEATFDEAQNKCKSLNSSLVQIDDDKEFSVLSDYFKTLPIPSFYVGVASTSSGIFQWVTGGELAQSSSWWCSGEPSESSPGYCGRMSNLRSTPCMDVVNCGAGATSRYSCEYSQADLDFIIGT